MAALNHHLSAATLGLTEMKGPWASELGQVPVPRPPTTADFRHRLSRRRRQSATYLRSTPGSSSPQRRHCWYALSWQRGETWLTEIRVPARWTGRSRTSLSARPVAEMGKPRHHHWRHQAQAQPGGASAALLLPMGTTGPAFLNYLNFDMTYLRWNKSFVYAHARRLLRRPGWPARRRSGRGADVEAALASATSRSCSACSPTCAAILIGEGGRHDRLRHARRRALRRQLQLGLPPDGYPDEHALLDRLRTRRR